MKDTKEIWACGGGTQSAAIAALIIQGKLPKPDYALIVDTNREKSQTWDYLANVIQPAMRAIGLDIVRIDRRQYATVDLYSQNGNDMLIPAFTTLNGQTSKMPALCSNEWKQRVMMRWLREQGVESGTAWMGISLDEMRRVRTPNTKWLQLRYPLIFDIPMRRSDCVALVQAVGWPDPPRSSCWMCPNMRNGEWREMKEHYPQDFADAVELERELRLKDPHLFLHESCLPLTEVNFTDYQTTLIDKTCNSGYCFV